jgi:hypothetical protein
MTALIRAAARARVHPPLQSMELASSQRVARCGPTWRAQAERCMAELLPTRVRGQYVLTTYSVNQPSLNRNQGSSMGLRPHAGLLLCAGGLLALSACGSGNSAATAGGVTSPAARQTSSSASESGASAESVRVGPYTEVFASPLPANAAQAEVIEGFREAELLWDKSELAQRLVPPVTAYVTGDALAHLTTALRFEKQQDLVPAGTDRFFMTRVTAIIGRSATVATCDDGSKFEEENPRTGVVDAAYAPQPDQAYLFETWHMVQLSGHWAITTFSLATLPDPSATPCQP